MEEGGFTHEFQRKIPLDKRKEESMRITQKHPKRVPIIIERAESCVTVPDIDKKKFLVPDDLTVGQLMFVVRKRLKNLTAEQGLFFFINNSMQPPSAILRTVYHDHKHEDGFLYVLYASENTFG